MKKSDPAFVEENGKLASVLRVLRNLIKELENEVSLIGKNGQSRSDSKEAYMDVVAKGGKIASAHKEIEHYKSFVPCPYFCRLDIVDENRKPLTLYFGKRGLSEDGIDITNWETDFYLKGYIGVVGENNEFTIKENVRFSTHGDAAPKEATYRAILKRAFDIKDTRLINVIPEYHAHKDEHIEGITDLFLQKLLLEKKTDNRLTDIIRSIQRNQASIVTHDLNSSFILQGCAGSGKTMILLHRLAYIKFNNPHLDLSKVKIITPSKSFNVHIHGLVIDLELNIIETMNVTDYYLHLLKKYENGYSSRRSVSNYSKQYTSIDVLPDDVNSGFLDSIYSEKFVSSCTTKFNEYFDNIDYAKILSEAKSICERVKYPIEYSDTTNEAYRGQRVSEFLFKIIETYEDKLKHCSKTEYGKLNRELTSLNNELRQNAKDKTSLERKCKSIEAKLSKLKDKSVSDKMETELLELWIRIDELNESAMTLQAKHLEIEQKVYQFERKNELMTTAEFNSLKEFRKLFHWKSIFAGIDVLFAEICLENGVDISDNAKTNKMYKFQLFLHLIFWSCLKGGVDNADKYLHIDEGQDISFTEYRVLTKINDGVTFNIYGDTNQLIDEERGIRNWTELKKILKQSNVFELSENYRNTAEITKHCNNTFGFDATPIGTEGNGVRYISIRGLVSELKKVSGSNRRVAVVAKDESFFTSVPVAYGNITYWTVKTVKGIEFDVVFVLDDNLTKNEKYIAYTRALSELIIVSG